MTEAKKREQSAPSTEEVLWRMLNTPPKDHSEMVSKKKAKKPSKKK